MGTLFGSACGCELKCLRCDTIAEVELWKLDSNDKISKYSDFVIEHSKGIVPVGHECEKCGKETQHIVVSFIDYP